MNRDFFEDNGYSALYFKAIDSPKTDGTLPNLEMPRLLTCSQSYLKLQTLLWSHKFTTLNCNSTHPYTNLRSMPAFNNYVAYPWFTGKFCMLFKATLRIWQWHDYCTDTLHDIVLRCLAKLEHLSLEVKQHLTIPIFFRTKAANWQERHYFMWV